MNENFLDFISELDHKKRSTQSTKNPLILSSRIRLARNISGYIFPNQADSDTNENVLQKLIDACKEHEHLKNSFLFRMENLNINEKKLLLEKHLISLNMQTHTASSAVIIYQKKHVSLLINEEDHLRIQIISPEYKLKDNFQDLTKLLSSFSPQIEWAHSDKFGYLTSCPSNIGTGIRASVMIHLPGLALSHQLNQVLSAFNSLKFAIRGWYGEGSEPVGHIYQISNQTSFGDSENNLIKKLSKMIDKLCQLELNAREQLHTTQRELLLDYISRAYGVIKYCHKISSKEAVECLSALRLGTHYGVLPHLDSIELDSYMTKIQPAHQNLNFGKHLSTESRDIKRANFLRKIISTH